MEKVALTISGVPIQTAGGAPTGGQSSLQTILQVGISYLYIAAAILAFLYLVWGGIDWIASGGDKQKLATARQKITFAIVGLVIAFFAYFIINTIGHFFNINLISLPSGGGGGGPPKHI